MRPGCGWWGRSPEAAEAKWDGRRHFFGAAAEAMRRILVENARRKKSLKYGGGLRARQFGAGGAGRGHAAGELLALDEALSELAATDPETVELIKLRFYAGLTDEQAAEMLGVSRRTADRMWAFARAWLYRAIRDGETGRM